MTFRLYKMGNDGEEESFGNYSQEFLSNLRVDDEIGLENDDTSYDYFKVTKRTFYEHDDGVTECDITVKETSI